MSTAFLSRFNLLFGLIVMLLLILVDSNSRRTIDKTTPRIISAIISFTLAAMICELAYQFIEGAPGPTIYFLCWTLKTFYYLFENLAFGSMPLFLDYSARTDHTRMKKLRFLIAGILLIYFTALAVNLFTGSLFTITPDNTYLRGKLYSLQLSLSYSFLILVLINTAISRKHMGKNKVALVLISTLPVAAGALLDVSLPNVMFIWPCFCVSLLFCYLFIVRISMLFDSLTGAYNRHGFDEYMLELEKAARRKAYSFIMIDIDRFKLINDAFGHAQGDVALKDVADILHDHVRRTDLVARYGGDEFVIIASAEETEQIMKNILQGIQEFNERKIRPFTLRLSCGGGLYLPDDQRSPQEFLSYVDTLMYADKAERRHHDLSKPMDFNFI